MSYWAQPEHISIECVSGFAQTDFFKNPAQLITVVIKIMNC